MTEARPNAWARLLHEVENTTSVEVEPRTVELEPEDPALFQHPFSVLVGNGPASGARGARGGAARALPELRRVPLRRRRDGKPARAVRRERPPTRGADVPDATALAAAERSLRVPIVLPSRRAGRTRRGHPRPRGHHAPARRRRSSSSGNDVSGALDRDAGGRDAQAVIPGGAAQRREALKLAINLVLYSLDVDVQARCRRTSMAADPRGAARVSFLLGTPLGPGRLEWSRTGVDHRGGDRRRGDSRGCSRGGPVATPAGSRALELFVWALALGSIAAALAQPRWVEESGHKEPGRTVVVVDSSALDGRRWSRTSRGTRRSRGSSRTLGSEAEVYHFDDDLHVGPPATVRRRGDRSRGGAAGDRGSLRGPAARGARDRDRRDRSRRLSATRSRRPARSSRRRSRRRSPSYQVGSAAQLYDAAVDDVVTRRLRVPPHAVHARR